MRLSYKFWNWVSRWASRLSHKAWMEKQRHDRKCPNCLRWYSATGSWEQMPTPTVDPLEDKTTCLECEAVTTWRHDSMLPRSVNVAIAP